MFGAQATQITGEAYRKFVFIFKNSNENDFSLELRYIRIGFGGLGFFSQISVILENPECSLEKLFLVQNWNCDSMLSIH